MYLYYWWFIIPSSIAFGFFFPFQSYHVVLLYYTSAAVFIYLYYFLKNWNLIYCFLWSDFQLSFLGSYTCPTEERWNRIHSSGGKRIWKSDIFAIRKGFGSLLWSYLAIQEYCRYHSMVTLRFKYARCILILVLVIRAFEYHGKTAPPSSLHIIEKREHKEKHNSVEPGNSEWDWDGSISNPLVISRCIGYVVLPFPGWRNSMIIIDHKHILWYSIRKYGTNGRQDWICSRKQKQQSEIKETLGSANSIFEVGLSVRET